MLFTPLFSASVALLLSSIPFVSAYAGEAVTFTDSFDDGSVQKAGARGPFWTVVQPEGNADSSAREKDGLLRLRAASWANTYVGIVSPVSKEFGFFEKPVTVTLDQISLKSEGIPEGDARFKLSLVSTPERAEKSANAISLRIRAGLLLFGYRADGFSPDTSPENLSGQRANSLVAAPLSGMPTKVTLTLGPATAAGSIRFEIHAEGNGVSFSRTGTFPLTREQWGKADAAALVIDARRDHAAELYGTYAELSLGQINVSR